MIVWKKREVEGDVMVADTEVQTQKSRMAYAFADHMMLAVMQGHGIGIAMHYDQGQPHEKAPSPMPMEEISRTACNLAEVLWAEMKRREFIMEFPVPEGWTETK
jgi:hypothetical protein